MIQRCTFCFTSNSMNITSHPMISSTSFSAYVVVWCRLPNVVGCSVRRMADLVLRKAEIGPRARARIRIQHSKVGSTTNSNLGVRPLSLGGSLR